MILLAHRALFGISTCFVNYYRVSEEKLSEHVEAWAAKEVNHLEDASTVSRFIHPRTLMKGIIQLILYKMAKYNHTTKPYSVMPLT